MWVAALLLPPPNFYYTTIHRRIQVATETANTESIETLNWFCLHVIIFADILAFVLDEIALRELQFLFLNVTSFPFAIFWVILRFLFATCHLRFYTFLWMRLPRKSIINPTILNIQPHTASQTNFNYLEYHPPLLFPMSSLRLLLFLLCWSIINPTIMTQRNWREILWQRWTAFVFNHFNAHKIIPSSQQ